MMQLTADQGVGPLHLVETESSELYSMSNRQDEVNTVLWCYTGQSLKKEMFPHSSAINQMGRCGAVLHGIIRPVCTPWMVMCVNAIHDHYQGSSQVKIVGGGGMGNSYPVSHFPLSNIVLPR